MADSRSVSGTVQVDHSSAEEAAFKLMVHISGYESESTGSKDRTYWLTLYHQCIKATSGRSLENVLKAN